MNNTLHDDHCEDCYPDECDDDCMTIDGRYVPAVNEYASTCDGCMDLTHHDHLTMDLKTQLGYCDCCVENMDESEKENFDHDRRTSNIGSGPDS